MTCAEFKQNLQAGTEYYISSDASKFEIVCQTEPIMERSKPPTPPPPPTPPFSPIPDNSNESKPWQGRTRQPIKPPKQEEIPIRDRLKKEIDSLEKEFYSGNR